MTRVGPQDPADPTVARARLGRMRLQRAVKRATDALLSGLLLVALLPLFVVVAIAIKLDSPGPIIFSQPRVGRGRRTFSFLKFRSMRHDQEQNAYEKRLRIQQEQGIASKSTNDDRITRVGRFLRWSSIDELPQLWNVLTGTMSLVGPRPLVPHMLEPFEELNELRSLVRPGITGLWQIRERGNNTSPRFMERHDVEYVRHWSLAVDATTLWRTIPVVLAARGAE